MSLEDIDRSEQELCMFIGKKSSSDWLAMIHLSSTFGYQLTRCLHQNGNQPGGREVITSRKRGMNECEFLTLLGGIKLWQPGPTLPAFDQSLVLPSRPADWSPNLLCGNLVSWFASLNALSGYQIGRHTGCATNCLLIIAAHPADARAAPLFLLFF